MFQCLHLICQYCRPYLRIVRRLEQLSLLNRRMDRTLRCCSEWDIPDRVSFLRNGILLCVVTTVVFCCGLRVFICCWDPTMEGIAIPYQCVARFHVEFHLRRIHLDLTFWTFLFHTTCCTLDGFPAIIFTEVFRFELLAEYRAVQHRDPTPFNSLDWVQRDPKCRPDRLPISREETFIVYMPTTTFSRWCKREVRVTKEPEGFHRG
mmetsp:Transcript_30215/g.73477  ORF Transcript_30215/g.73477 Transcript_30215/m.73477 type:complete len:206 (-) Transcript_30215:746-1363(-)